MKYAAMIVVLLGLSIQDKPPASPEVPAQSKVDILLAQRALAGTREQADFCQHTNFQQIYTTQSTDLQKAVDAAFASAKVSKDDYDIDMDALKFVKKAPPKRP